MKRTKGNEEVTVKSEDEEKEDISWGCWLRTVFAASGAMMVFIFTGITEAQSAVMLPQLKKEDSYIHVTPDEETWIASLGILLAPAGALLAGPAVDAFGRKKGLQCFYLGMGLGFGVIACAREVYQIYIGRCICAFSVGLEPIAVIYLAEICTKRQRSCFFSLMSVTYSLGVTLTYIVGGYLPWNIASAAFSLACFVYLLIQSLTPESPAWLYKAGKPDASTRTFQRLGRNHPNILRELELLRLSSKEETNQLQLSTFLQPTVWKPFLVLSLFHLFHCGSGIYDILYYTLDFVEALGTTYDPLTVSIVMSIARLITNITIGLYFTASLSRRFATAFSSFFMAASLAGMGAYEFAVREYPVKPFQWVPVFLGIVSIVGCALGVLPLPWLMPGEMFPLQVRGAMTGAVFIVGTAFMFVTLKLYAFCMETLKIWGTCFLFACFAFFGVFFGIFILPETQNKTLFEIEKGFLPRNKRVEIETTQQQTESSS